MFKHDFEIYAFDELPQESKESMLTNAKEMYAENKELHDSIVHNMMTGTLYIRVDSDEERDMFLPIPLSMCSSALKIALLMKAEKK